MYCNPRIAQTVGYSLNFIDEKGVLRLVTRFFGNSFTVLGEVEIL